MLTDKKACIFDLDGTIINSMEYWASLDKKLIFTLSGKSYMDNFQALWENKMKEYKNYASPMISYCDYLADTYRLNIRGEELLEKRNKMIGDIYRRDVSAKKGVKEYIKKLYNEGLIIAVATTTGRANVNALRENDDVKELFEMFSAIYTYDDIEKRKPDPMVHMRFLEEFKLKAEDCIVFEDSLVGVYAANNAGIDVIAVMDELSLKDKENIIKNAVRYIESFEEILE